MKDAETVTFGGSALNRAAHLRPESGTLESMAADPQSRHVIFWRGKPLLTGDRQGELALIPGGAPILQEPVHPPIFLGLSEEGTPLFAHDLSRWQPEGQDVSTLGAFLDPGQQHHPLLPEDHLFCELRSRMFWLTPRDAELAATAKALLEWHRTHRFCARCGHPSAVTMAGWQRTCAECGGHHFPRTDPVVIMLVTHGNNVLLGRSPGWPDGMYSLLAGFVEPGETLEAAVRREVFEESGIQTAEVDYLACQPWPFPNSLMVAMRARATSTEITVDPAELEDARWVPREEMMQAMSGQHSEILPARKGAIAQFILSMWLADRLD